MTTNRRRFTHFATLALATIALGLALFAPAASAKEAIAFFPTDAYVGDIAVNTSGAGPADAHDIYVVGNNRIERFAQNDNGTPANPYDDTYPFRSAWGAGVLTGTNNFEICTVAADCKAGIASGGNGSLSLPFGIAVDQDTGNVYVVDRSNNRIDVYAGDGTFLRSFGFDVVASGPDNAGTGYEVCIAANGDVCKVGTVGPGVGQINDGRSIAVSQPDGNPATGTVFLADAFNHRVDTYNLDGSSPSFFGSAAQFSGASSNPLLVAVDSRGIVYASNSKNGGEIDRYDSQNANGGGVGFLAPIPAQTITLSGGPGDATGSNPYVVTFTGLLGGSDVSQLTATNGATPLSGGAGASVATTTPGGPGTDEVQQVTIGATAGQFRLAFDGQTTGATGTGNLTSGSKTIANLTTATGAFVAGEEISGAGISAGTGTGNLSAATGTGDFTQGSDVITNVVTSTGAFAVGQTLRDGATGNFWGITAVGAGTLTLASSPSFRSTAGVTLTAGSRTVSNVATSTGAFAVDQVITGRGVPSGTTITAVGAGTLTLSNLATQAGTAVSLAGKTRITAVNHDTLTLSTGATATNTGVALSADLPFDASSQTVLSALRALSSIPSPPLSVTNTQHEGLEVDPDSDGPGPDKDVLYVLRDGFRPITVVQQFGPLNQPGLTAPPAAEDAHHGSLVGFGSVPGLGLDDSNGRLFVATPYTVQFGVADPGVYVLDTAGGLPTASLDSLSNITSTTVTAHATIDPNGPPATSYHLEYSTDGITWTPTPSVLLGSQPDPQAIDAVLNPPGGGLEPSTLYHVRLAAAKAFTPPVITAAQTFTTLPAPPIAETVGSPVRTATTAQLGGRVTPRNTATTYHFEYGAQGPCDSNPCTSTASHPAGSGDTTELVSQGIENLQPNTTYHYRIVADNGNPGSPAFGAEMTLTTRASDAPLSHGHFPGPPGSDRAWEQVNAAELSGNAVQSVGVISDDGSRAIYQVGGGTPTSVTGSANQFYAERTASGWQTKDIYPSRDQLPGTSWDVPMGRSDLSAYAVPNFPTTGGGLAAFRISPTAAPVKLYQGSVADFGGFFSASDSASTVLLALRGSPDPAHPAAPNTPNLYNVAGGAPQLLSLLPGGAVPPCGATVAASGSASTIPSMPPNNDRRSVHWLSADGNLLFFPSRGDPCGPDQLYVRDIAAAQTKLVSGPPLSGAACPAAFIGSSPDAAFFWTQTRLAAEDTNSASCDLNQSNLQGGDVYRYDLAQQTLECLTCLTPGVDADVSLGTSRPTNVAVAEDGSRLYFSSPHRLLAGAAPGGLYRLDVATGDLAYVGFIGADGLGAADAVLNPDGSVLAFRSSDPSLNPLGGANNGASSQYYRYDDNDRSLLCVSCPQDGASPAGSAIAYDPQPAGPNMTPLSAAGELVFATPTSLLPADQNTAGPGQDPSVGNDVYEWRDGRLLLITDGITSWPPGLGNGPGVAGVSPSGHDVLFTASAQLTPDAIDGFRRLYDARIGGGFDFPVPPPPCPLEVCQGTPKGAPEDPFPASATFSGPANPTPSFVSRCRKGKVRRHGRCVARHPHKKHHKRAHRRANHNRRVAR